MTKAMTPERYARLLARTGMEEREVARAYFFVKEFGMERVTSASDACLTFATPSCGDWNCVSPQHQLLEESHSGA
jgi:hypothetical protein